MISISTKVVYNDNIKLCSFLKEGKEMSFGINGPDNIPAIQKSHHTNDGGAGNLGYFQQRRKKKNDEEEEKDIFEFSSKEEESDEVTKVDSIGNRIKNFWMKFHLKNDLEKEINKIAAEDSINKTEE